MLPLQMQVYGEGVWPPPSVKFQRAKGVKGIQVPEGEREREER